MFQELWGQIKNQKAGIALKTIGMLPFENVYLLHVAKILEAEAHLQLGNFEDAVRLAKDALAFFRDYDRHRNVGEFSQDLSGIRITFLESCMLNWIAARGFAGLTSWHQSYSFAKEALGLWDNYRLSRLPFLDIAEGEHLWMTLPQEIKAHLAFLQKFMRLPLSKEEWLDLLVPENFTLKKYETKTNHLTKNNPKVSVCIATYRDAEWLQFTVDSILKSAGYENFEIVIILQREPDNESDATGRFLEKEPYLSNPKIKVVRFDQPLGCERAKRQGVEHSCGELVISLDGHVITSENFMAKTVKLFLDYPEVSFLGYGIVDAYEDRTIYGYFHNEIPYLLHAIFGLKVLRNANPEAMIAYKPGLFIRQSVMGAAFCFTRRLYDEVGGYLLNDRTWGDKAFAVSAYLYGYQIFGSPELVCVHRSHLKSLYHPNPWTEDFKVSEKGYALEECTISSLMVGYFYFSEKYFQEHFLSAIRQYSGKSFDRYWQEFQTLLPTLCERKSIFWKGAVRTLREYWLQYGDFIWTRLEEQERRHLFPAVSPKKKPRK